MNTRSIPAITLEERKAIQKYIAMGLSGHKISEILYRGSSTVNFEIRRNGGRANYDADAAQENSISMKKTRLNKINRKITKEEESIISESIKILLSKNEIMRRTGLSKAVLNRYLHENEINYKTNDFSLIESRIKSLEFQIEILTEQIRSLNVRNIINN